MTAKSSASPRCKDGGDPELRGVLFDISNDLKALLSAMGPGGHMDRARHDNFAQETGAYRRVKDVPSPDGYAQHSGGRSRSGGSTGYTPRYPSGIPSSARAREGSAPVSRDYRWAPAHSSEDTVRYGSPRYAELEPTSSEGAYGRYASRQRDRTAGVFEDPVRYGSSRYSGYADLDPSVNGNEGAYVGDYRPQTSRENGIPGEGYEQRRRPSAIYAHLDGGQSPFGPASFGTTSSSARPMGAMNSLCTNVTALLGQWQLAGEPWGEPVMSRLATSMYPILEVCIDAYYASKCNDFQGDYEFRQHLHAAACFLEEGADPQVSESVSGASCVHYAAGSGSVDLCELLVAAKADALARDSKLQTPIFWAIASHNTSMCYYLVRHSEAIATSANARLMTPLHSAVFYAHIDIIEVLLPFYDRMGPDVRGRDQRTPLHVAAQKCHYTVAVMLVEASADPQIKCAQGKTVLHYAAEQGGQNLELCQYLLMQRPASRKLRDSKGRNPLELAANNGCLNPELRNLLNTPKAAKNQQEKYGGGGPKPECVFNPPTRSVSSQHWGAPRSSLQNPKTAIAPKSARRHHSAHGRKRR